MRIPLTFKKYNSFVPTALGISLFSVFATLPGCTGSIRDAVQSNGSESKVETDTIPQYFGEESEDISEVFAQVHKRFALDRDDDGNVIFIVRKDLDPAVTSEILSGLASWSESRGEKPGGSALSIKDFPVVDFPMSGADTMAYNVSAAVPEIVKALHLQYPGDGPNCWNLTLLTANLSKIFGTTQEIQFYEAMNQPQVVKVTKLKEVREGDIVAVRLRDSSPEGFTEIHAATYVAPNLLWTKNGARESKPFRLMDSE